MRISNWTILLTTLTTLISSTLSKSISILDIDSLVTTTPPAHHITVKIEALKERMRSQIPDQQRNIYNSLSKFNATLEEKRQLLRKYKERLQRLNERHQSVDQEEPIHKREIHSFRAAAPAGNSAKVGIYKFPTVKIAQPRDYTKELKVQSAMLSIHRQDAASHLDKLKLDRQSKSSSERNLDYNVVLSVHQTLPGGYRRLVTSKVVSLARSGWIKLDVTDIVQSWVTEPGMNYGIEVECPAHNLTQILTPFQEGDTNTPTLDIVIYEKAIVTQRRQRRDVSPEECSSDGCCRRPVNIKASHIGLPDHIVHGEYIEAYICSGSCPNNHKLHTFWAAVKDKLNYDKHCAPVAYSQTYTHMYYDEELDDLVETVFNDLIVSQCACV